MREVQVSHAVAAVRPCTHLGALLLHLLPAGLQAIQLVVASPLHPPHLVPRLLKRALPRA